MKHFKFFIPFILSLILVFSVPSYASDHGGGGSSRGFGIYDNNSLNARAIAAWESMTDYEKKDYVRELYPLFLAKLGGKLNGLDYNAVAAYYERRLNRYKEFYHDDPEEFLAAGLGWRQSELYVSSDRRWYNDFSDFLVAHINTDSGYVIGDNTTSGSIVELINDYTDEYMVDSGFIDVDIYSYKNINSSNFQNLTAYNNFITLCNNNKNYKFVIVGVMASGKIQNVAFSKAVPNLYSNGKTPDGHLRLCNSSGVLISSTANYNMYINYNGYSTWDVYTRSSAWTGVYDFYIGSANPNAVKGDFGSASGKFSIYTLESVKTNYRLNTSLNGWINSNGHYEPPFEFYSNWGSVPSFSISPSDITNYYTATFNPSNNNSNDVNINITYPNSYDNYNDNSYDPDSKKLSFNGITDLLSSIGSFLGSIINGVASGLANLIDSISSIAQNLIEFFTNGIIFNFLKAFLSWLPDPIPTLLSTLFTLAVIFAVIKLVKGAFS